MPLWAIGLIALLFLICVLVNKVKLLYNLLSGKKTDHQVKKKEGCLTDDCQGVVAGEHGYCNVCYELEEKYPCQLCGVKNVIWSEISSVCDRCKQELVLAGRLNKDDSKET